MIILPFAVSFSDDTTALLFYLIVGAGGLLATLATRFPGGMTPRRASLPHEAA
jgi:hypothetical protein